MHSHASHMYVYICVLMPLLAPKNVFCSESIICVFNCEFRLSVFFPFCIVCPDSRLRTKTAAIIFNVCNMNEQVNWELNWARTLFSFDIIKIINYMIYCFALLCGRLLLLLLLLLCVCLHFWWRLMGDFFLLFSVVFFAVVVFLLLFGCHSLNCVLRTHISNLKTSNVRAPHTENCHRQLIYSKLRIYTPFAY